MEETQPSDLYIASKSQGVSYHEPRWDPRHVTKVARPGLET